MDNCTNCDATKKLPTIAFTDRYICILDPQKRAIEVEDFQQIPEWCPKRNSNDSSRREIKGN